MIDRDPVKLRSWRNDVAEAASRAMRDGIFFGPISVILVFDLPRPRSHYGTGRNQGKLRRSAPSSPQLRPDIDKLARAVLDALTGVCFHDDAQVVRLGVEKKYADSGGLTCTIIEWQP